jgi:hypothetical protein
MMAREQELETEIENLEQETRSELSSESLLNSLEYS